MEIRKYAALLMHWWWLIVLGVIVAAGSAYIVSANTTPIYRATTQLLVEPSNSSDSSTYVGILATEKSLQTDVVRLTASEVLVETIRRLNLPYDVPTLRGLASASAPIDTLIIDLDIEDTSLERAKLIANTIAQVFIEQNEAKQNARYAEPSDNLLAERDIVGNQIEELDVEINQLNALDSLTAEQSSRLSRLETQRNELRIQYTNLFNSLQDIRIQAATESNTIVVIEPAQGSASPIRPNTFSNVVLAAVVGGMLALGIIFLMDYLDDTIKTPDEIMQDTGLSSIGVISFIKGDKPSDRLITHLTPRAPTSEAYRVLRTNLEFSSVDEPLKNLLVTSPSPSEGKSTTAANLGTVLAQTGNRVVLIDADLRRPSQHKVFELPNNRGLTTALLDSEAPINYHIQDTRVPGLRLMTSGPLPPNPAELLRSHRMQQILDDLKHEADIVLLDTPPTLTVADASILAPRVNGCVLVTKLGSTSRDALIQAVEGMSKTGANLFGVVLNRATPRAGGYYYNYYYYRYYTYEYGDKRPNQDRGLLARWFSGSGANRS